MDTRPSSAMLHAQGADRGTAATKPFRNQDAVTYPNRGLLHWMQPAPDRLTHIGWACACLSGRVAPRWTRPQTPPSNESWTADEPRPRSDPAACQTTNAL